MKDRQIQQGPPQLRIPFISAWLHCISMTAIVFMRSSFGFTYLRPRSVFFSFTWALALFCYYAWHEPLVWAQYWLVCIYGTAAAMLYWLNLIFTFFREMYSQASHDYDSGTPHTIRILRLVGQSPSPLFAKNWQVWGEPILVLLGGLGLRLASEKHLSYWLMWVAPCFSLKEALNFWFQVRQRKRHADSQVDAEEIFDGNAPNSVQVEAPKGVGKQKVKRARMTESSADDAQKLRRSAEVLRLFPPYSLLDAEENYRRLIKLYHPDSGDNSDGAAAAEINEAIEFLRIKLGSNSPP